MKHPDSTDMIVMLVRENQCLAVANVVAIIGQTRLGLASADASVKEYTCFPTSYEDTVAGTS